MDGSRGWAIVMCAAAAASAGPALAIPPPLDPNAITCTVEPADGFQRDCRFVDGRAPSPQERLTLRDYEGKLTLWLVEKPQTADAPFAFRGWWVEPGKPCVAWGDDSQLRIGVNLAQFYAGEGRIRSVKALGEREVELVLDTGAVPADQPVLHLKLSEDGNRLFQMDLDNGYERVRCDGWP